MGLDEPDVAITDFLLTIECAVFVFLLLRRARSPIETRFIGIFACIGFASLLGGIVHGFFADEESAGFRALWPPTLLCLSAMASFIWMAGAELLLPARARGAFAALAGAAWLATAAVILSGAHGFGVVVASYVPSIVWLAVGYLAEMGRSQRRRLLVIGIVGLLLTLVAASIQRAEIALHPRWFDHNALYHVTEALALLLSFISTAAFTPATAER